MVKKHIPGYQWSNVFAFKANSGNCCNYGDRVPLLGVSNKGFFSISNAVNGNGIYAFDHKLELNKWYKITIQQIELDGKVRESLENYYILP